MAHSNHGKSRPPWSATGGARKGTFLWTSLASALLLSAAPFSAAGAAPAANDAMHVVQPDATTTLKSLSLRGRYTLVLLSPPSGQCDPCDELWAQLGGTSDLSIEVVKVLIDDGQTRPKILTEVRRLIYSSMELPDGSDIFYPMGVMLDPNGVVVQATFGKPRIDRKIREVTAALSAAPASSNAASVQQPAPGSSSGAPTAASTVKPAVSYAELAAVAGGVGAVAGGLSLLGVLGGTLARTNGIIQIHCPADGPCDFVGRAAIARRNDLQGLGAAALLTAGVGAMIVAEIAVFKLHERATRSGSLRVAAAGTPDGVSLSVGGEF